MYHLFLHKKLIVRFLTLYLIGILLFLIAWTIGYQFLPEGVLRGKSIASQLAGSDAGANVWLEWLKIISINLFSCLLVVLANLFMIKDKFPLGYLIPVQWFIYYGLLLGTNSFSIPMESAMAPTFRVLERSGIYEISAYTLIAAATCSIFRYRLNSFFSNAEKIQSKQKLGTGDKIGIGIAILILFASNLREAFMITF